MNARTPTTLQIELLSDSTFGRGEGTAGEVDVEVEHDAYGIPFIGGRTIRGLLRDSWLSMRPNFASLYGAGNRVLGPTRDFAETGVLRIGDALLHNDIRQWLLAAATRAGENWPLSPNTILAACTDIRYQTAEDRETGAPAATTLRSSRVVLRGFLFVAPLTWLDDHETCADEQKVLAMTALATRHGGWMRNRGRGFLKITLDGDLKGTRKVAGVGDGEGGAA